jgi:pimeloyl-ACP methyl ester carboxylesterase
MGGLTMRAFAHDYPSDVAGVVLIESMSPGQFTQSAADTQSQASPQSHAFSIPSTLARSGLVRLLVKPLGLVPYVPPDETAYFSRFVRPQDLQAFSDEGQALPESVAQAAAVKTFGDLPLIILSWGLDQQRDWIKMQTELLQLSSNSQQLIAEKSGHNIEIDQPQAAVAAFVKMVEQVRQ